MRMGILTRRSSAWVVSASLLWVAAASAGDKVQLTGAGATFPFPIYSKWFSEYAARNPGVEINYQSIGSGGGIRQILDKTVDFGASDAPMADDQLAKANPPLLHIPTVLGAVVLTYNLPGLEKPLNLSGPLVADLFLGKVAKWNDPAVAGLNPGVKLPDTPVMIVHRADGSGTTAVFTDYLAKVSPEWKQKVGTGNALKWPVGLGGKGNEGVTGLIKQTPGSLGYVELVYAASNQMPQAVLKNRAGKLVAASSRSVTAAAAASAKTMPADFRVSITDAEGKDAYPISSYTYLLVYQQMPGIKGQTLVRFLNWAITDGQNLAESLNYAPLPKPMIAKVKARIGQIKTQ